MKRFVSFMKDTIYDLNIFLFTLIVIALVGFVLQNRIHAMYTNDYSSQRENANNSLSEVKVENVYPDHNAPKIDISVILPEGTSTIDTSRILVEAKVISDPEEFINYLRTNNLEDSVQNGEFTISKEATLEEVVNIITGNVSSETEDTDKNAELENFQNQLPQKTLQQ